MRLRTHLLELARSRGAGVLSVRRIESAMRTIESELGDLDPVLLTGGPLLAQKVRVEGDGADYVVIGEWSDGTFDLVREQGSFSSDCLVGWRPGQTLDAFRAELRAEPADPPQEMTNGRGKVHPLRRDAPSPRRT